LRGFGRSVGGAAREERIGLEGVVAGRRSWGRRAGSWMGEIVVEMVGREMVMSHRERGEVDFVEGPTGVPVSPEMRWMMCRQEGKVLKAR
jgi:hypothetical protein